MKIELINKEHPFQLVDEDTGEVFSALNYVLQNRGVEDVDSFFNIGWETVQSPYDLKNMELAAQTIARYFNDDKRFCFLLDCDMDGYSSTSLLINYLVRQNPNFKNNIEVVIHEGKQHGLGDTQAMREIRDIAPDILVIPDASGSLKQYVALNDLGIKIVVLDHHDTDNEGNGEDTIVVNPQLSPKYKNKNIAGGGVVWQCCRILDDIFNTEIANEFLDLAACACVADVMDLRSDETRFIVYQGLSPENINNPFLLELIDKLNFSLKGKLDAMGVSWYIAPLINAIVRIGSIDEKKMVFNAFLEHVADTEIVTQARGKNAGSLVSYKWEAARIAANAKSRQKSRQNKLTAAIETVIAEGDLYKNGIILVKIDDFNADERALSGLIANKLQDYYNRPALLLYDQGDGHFSGSVRAPESIPAFANFKSQCAETNLTDWQAGHELAFGLSILEDNIQDFIDYFNNRYDKIDLSSMHRVDFAVDAEDPDLGRIIKELATFDGNWGHGIKPPLIAVENIKVSRLNTQLLSAHRNPTLKFSLPSGAECIKFWSSREEFDSLTLPIGNAEVEQAFNTTVVGEASINEWNGKITPQIQIRDYEAGDVEYLF